MQTPQQKLEASRKMLETLRQTAVKRFSTDGSTVKPGVKVADIVNLSVDCLTAFIIVNKFLDRVEHELSQLQPQNPPFGEW